MADQIREPVPAAVPAPAAPDPRNAADRLRALIASRNLSTAFQPIIDLSRGRVVAFEALARPGPDSGFDNPMQMFRAAADAGLLWELEEVTRLASLRDAADWPSDVKLFLNCTPEVFGDPRFVSAIEAALQTSPGEDGQGGIPIPPSRIVIEITEQSDDQHVRNFREQLDRLRAIGIQIAIDDVGAGASGLSRIMAIRPQWLKLDREFVEAIHLDRMKQNLVRFFVHFAGLSGASVIAEGIEDGMELAQLISLGVRFAQGYYLGKPAARGENLEPAIGAWARERWAAAEAVEVDSVQTTPVVRLCKPAMLVQASARAEEVLQLLDGQDLFEGVIVFDGRRCIGACNRGALAAALRWRGRDVSVGAIAQDAPTINPDATLAEAMQTVAGRRDEELAAPLVIADGAEVIGVLRVKDLLHAAAAVAGKVVSTTVRTGLPGRDEAERFVTGLVARGRLAGAPWDAAFIDVQRFAHFTGTYGAQVGEALIESIAALISKLTTTRVPGGVGGGGLIHAWHLGDDRFLLIGPPAELEAAVRTLVHRFDTNCTTFGCTMPDAPTTAAQSPAPGASPSHDLPPVSIRAILLPDASSRVHSLTDLYRLEHQLKQRSRGPAFLSSRSQLLTDEREDSYPIRKIA